MYWYLSWVVPRTQFCGISSPLLELEMQNLCRNDLMVRGTSTVYVSNWLFLLYRRRESREQWLGPLLPSFLIQWIFPVIWFGQSQTMRLSPWPRFWSGASYIWRCGTRCQGLPQVCVGMCGCELFFGWFTSYIPVLVLQDGWSLANLIKIRLLI